jgi:hypothetical protein
MAADLQITFTAAVGISFLSCFNGGKVKFAQ